MKRLLTGFGLLLAFTGCGPSYGPTGIKSPEERIREQELLAYEEEKEAKKTPDPIIPDEPEEEVGEFDEEQAKLELTRATASAESCTGVVDTEKVRGDAEVGVTFQQDGSVSDATLSQYADTATGKCALRAYKAIIVPPFRGSVKQMTWKLVFEDEKAKKAREAKKVADEAKAKKAAEAAEEKAAKEEEKKKAAEAKAEKDGKGKKKKETKPAEAKSTVPRLWGATPPQE
jgi:hypothetical protein